MKKARGKLRCIAEFQMSAKKHDFNANQPLVKGGTVIKKLSAKYKKLYV